MPSDISAFVTQIMEARSDFERAVLQLNFALGTEVKKRVVKNIDDTFGQNLRGGLAAYRQGASGALRQSVSMEGRQDGSIDVYAGGPGVPYAAIHEYGGVITPKRKKWLTIPVHDSARGRMAGDFNNLYFALLGPGRAALFFKDTRQMAFYLVKRVEIPARPYFGPAVEYVRENVAQDLSERILGRALNGR